MEMKTENNIQNIQVGDIIKSYDFEPLDGRPEIYMIGRVERIEGDIVHFYLLKQMYGEVQRPQRPEEARQCSTCTSELIFGDFENRITIIEKSHPAD